jgi:murein DD-endopeptidase MepM/ murein hydrolase activator NlpD
MNESNRDNVLLQRFPTLIALALVGMLATSMFSDKTEENTAIPNDTIVEAPVTSVFGFNASNFHIEKMTIMPNQFLANILQDREITYDQIQSLVKNSADIFSVRSFRSGKDLTFIREDECDAPKYMIYEPSPLTYIKYEFEEELVNVEKVERRIDLCTDEAFGKIESSLSATMSGLGLGMGLISKMEDALASSVDFYHLQKGDEFKIVFEEIFVDGEKIKEGNILGAYFKNDQGEHYAVHFENERYSGYYDMEGHPTKGAFLRAPVKYARISSGYNLRRFHPIKKRTIPHLGTDYAAPRGTPIISVSDGVVTKVSYTKNNGKYVKIRHDKTYETQYLHMNGFAKGIKSGTKVKQGQTIGYVGSTGLATGPHVCFRFWKNGRQINHRRENFPPADPLPDTDLPQFHEQADSIRNLLDTIDPLDYI